MQNNKNLALIIGAVVLVIVGLVAYTQFMLPQPEDSPLEGLTEDQQTRFVEEPDDSIFDPNQDATMNGDQDPNTPVSSEDAEETESVEDEASVKEFEVRGGGFYFEPSELTVNEGDTVRITFVNEGGTHDWVLDEFDARTQIIQGGESETIEFVADSAGTYEYYCSVGNHREQGMVGTLIVQ